MITNNNNNNNDNDIIVEDGIDIVTVIDAGDNDNINDDEDDDVMDHSVHDDGIEMIDSIDIDDDDDDFDSIGFDEESYDNITQGRDTTYHHKKKDKSRKPRYYRHIDSIVLRCQLIQKLHSIVNHPTDNKIDHLCHPCMNYLVDICEQKYHRYQDAIRQYGMINYGQLQEKVRQQAKLTGFLGSFNDDFVSDIDGYADSIQKLSFEIDELERQFRDCEEEIKKIEVIRVDINAELEKSITDSCFLEEEYKRLDDDLQRSLSLIDSASREIELLKHQSLVVKPLYDVFLHGGITAINGLRVRYLPSSDINLNWSEINAGWSCMGSLVSILRKRAGLPATVDMLRNRSSGKESTGIRLQLRPLRKRVIILKSVFVLESVSQVGLQIKTTIDASGKAVVETEDCSLVLEGGADSRFEYRRALVMFCVFVVVTASQIRVSPEYWGGSAQSLLEAARRGSDSDLWGFDDDDMDEYYDVDEGIQAEFNPGEVSSRPSKTSAEGNKIDQLVEDVLVLLRRFAAL